MNLQRNPTAEGGAPPSGATDAAGTTDATAAAPASGPTTHSDKWERAAALTPNKDLHVPVVDLIFDGQSVEVEVLEPELIEGEGQDRTQAVRHSFRTKGELTSIDQPPIKKGPGHVIRPFPYELTDAGGNHGQRQDISQRDLNHLLIAAGLARKSDELSKGQILAMQGKLAGTKVMLKLSTRKYGKPGDIKTAQNIRFAAVGEQAQAGVTNGPGDY